MKTIALPLKTIVYRIRPKLIRILIGVVGLNPKYITDLDHSQGVL